jgi:hypothetical protein
MNALQKLLGFGGKIPIGHNDYRDPRPGVEPYKIAVARRKVSKAARYAPIAAQAEPTIGARGKCFGNEYIANF